MRLFVYVFLVFFVFLFRQAADAQSRQDEQLSLRTMDSLRQLMFRSHLVNINQPGNLPTSLQRRKPPVVANNTTRIAPVNVAKENAPACVDTSLRLTYSKSKDWLANDYITRTHDGNILIPGFDYQSTPPYTGIPHVLKMTTQGDTLWSRAIDVGYTNTTTDLYRAFELHDGSILLVGNLPVPCPYNGRNDFLMVKLAANGDFIWRKTFSNTYWFSRDTTGGSTDIYDCGEDAAGNTYLCGVVEWFGFGRTSLLFKMDTAGTILWSKNFYIHDLSAFTGIDVSGNDLKVFGYYTTNYTLGMFAISADKQTGDTLWSKAWASTDEYEVWHRFVNSAVTKLDNGNYALYGYSFNSFYNYDTTQLTTHCGMAEFTPDFEPVQAKVFRSPARSANSPIISVFKDGSIAYARQLYLSGYNGDVIFGSYENGQIVKERSLAYRGISNAWISNFLPLNDGGQIITNFYGDSINNTNGIELIRLHNSDTASSCLGYDIRATVVEPVQLTRVNMYADSIESNVLFERFFHPFNGVRGDTFIVSSHCRQTSYCDSLRLIPSSIVLCPGIPATLSIRKNKACGASPFFSYDTAAVQSFNRLDDTTMSITFSKAWKGYIRAGISGCTPVEDSVLLTVLQAPSSMNLGPDTVICPGNAIQLNAGNGYAAYQWQDGSSDSTFIITKPGKYYVTATNACGGSFSDTVIATSHPPIPFHVSANITICEGDSVTITAPGGFTNYQWSPVYGINTPSGQTAILSPHRDQMYKVTAEQTKGCIAVDSFYVSVKPVPVIHLGNDTSLCEGETLLLTAGSGFDLYQWNTGAVASSISVSTPGFFSVQAVKDGCPATDTLQVKAVYPLPHFSLGSDTTLCEGQLLQYDISFPGAIYQWNSGASTETQTISQPGTYALQVSQNGCTYKDTVRVVYKPLPVFSLGKDTVLCDGDMLMLQAANAGVSYQWQDGSVSSAYQIKKAGLYTLTEDLNGCRMTDSINIRYQHAPYFSLGKDTFLCQGTQLLLRPEVNVPVSFLWNNGSTSNSYTVNVEGVYYVTAIGNCGAYTDSVYVAAVVCQIAMPTAFTPDGNGVNDVFRIKYPFPVRSFRMVIFSRWGQKVFETSDITKGWNGMTSSYPANADTYIWQISYTTLEGQLNTFNGTVVLLR